MEQKQVKFPLKFNQCPNCGSEERVTKVVLDNEHTKGKAMKATDSHLIQCQSLITNPNMPFLSAPMVVAYLDACADCGTIYCVRAEVITAVPGVKLPGNRPQHIN